MHDVPHSGAHCVPWNVISDISFIPLLTYLKEEEDKARPKRKKADADFDENESRDVLNPMCGLDFLLTSLDGSPITKQVMAQKWGVRKELRNQVRYESSALPWRRALSWADSKLFLLVTFVHNKSLK